MKILTGIPTPSPLQYLTAQPPQPTAKLVVLFCKVVCVRPMGLETSGGPSVVIPELGSTYFCSLCGLSESLGFSGGSDSKKKKKNLPAIQETPVRSLGWEDLLEKGMATHFSILFWKNPVDRGAWRVTAHGVAKESDMTEQLHFHFSESSSCSLNG